MSEPNTHTNTERRYPKVAGHPALALAGRAPDAVVAVLIGCTPDGVRYQRAKTGAEQPDVEAWRRDNATQAEVIAFAMGLIYDSPERDPEIWRALDRYMPIAPGLLNRAVLS